MESEAVDYSKVIGKKFDHTIRPIRGIFRTKCDILNNNNRNVLAGLRKIKGNDEKFLKWYVQHVASHLLFDADVKSIECASLKKQNIAVIEFSACKPYVLNNFSLFIYPVYVCL